MTRGSVAPRLLATIACASGLVVSASASAVAYRCTVDGRTTYSDRPCTSGTQSQLAVDAAPPSAADRAAAEERLRIDQRTAAELQRERLAREQVAPVSAKANAEHARQARNCAKLTLRARRAPRGLRTRGSARPVPEAAAHASCRRGPDRRLLGALTRARRSDACLHERLHRHRRATRSRSSCVGDRRERHERLDKDARDASRGEAEAERLRGR